MPRLGSYAQHRARTSHIRISSERGMFASKGILHRVQILHPLWIPEQMEGPISRQLLASAKVGREVPFS